MTKKESERRIKAMIQSRIDVLTKMIQERQESDKETMFQDGAKFALEWLLKDIEKKQHESWLYDEKEGK